MKKIIAIICVTIMTISIISCAKQEPIRSVTSISINDLGELITTYSDGTSENLGIISKGIESISINDLGEMITTNTDGTKENIGQISCEDIWRERDDTIYLTTKDHMIDNIENPNLLITLAFTDSLKRIGTNGIYNKVILNNKIYYIKADSCTTNEEEITFNQNTTLMYANKDTILRKYPNSENKDIEQISIAKNAKLICTGTNKTNTWAKIEYNSRIYYCKTEDISSEKVN